MQLKWSYDAANNMTTQLFVVLETQHSIQLRVFSGAQQSEKYWKSEQQGKG